MPHHCAFGCKHTGNVMHSFPNPGKYPERFKDWVNLVGNDLETLSADEIYKKKRICDIHFTNKHRNRFKRLSTLAMPTLHLPGECHDIKATAGQSETSLSVSQHTTSTSFPSTVTPGDPAEAVITKQQPDGNDQAVAKRALNETISPRGDHKRRRLDQSQQLANESYAQAANSALNVAITCSRRGIISQEVSDQVLTAIQKQILSEACSPMQDTPGPSFNGKPLFAGGVLKLWCGNDHTLAWLKKTVSSLALPASTSLVVKSQSEIQKRVRCGIVIPDDQGIYEDSTFIGRALCYQNPWVDVKRWVVLHAEKQGASWFVVLGIPEDQIPTLMSSERRLSIGLGSVYVKFQGPTGRYVDVPRGWDPITKQLLDIGETIPPPNKPEATAADPAGALKSSAPAANVGAIPSKGGSWST